MYTLFFNKLIFIFMIILINCTDNLFTNQYETSYIKCLNSIIDTLYERLPYNFVK